MKFDPDTMRSALSWVVDSTQAEEWAIADLLARELDPHARSAVHLLISPDTPLALLVRAKSIFKTLRVEGETPEDRHLGSVLYASAIAAALVHHGEHISRQREASLRRALARIDDDLSLPRPLRALASTALTRLPPAP